MTKVILGEFTMNKKVIIKKKRKEYVLGDVNKYDFDLMRQAYFLTDPTQFVCFGKHYSKLKALKLVNGENQLTYEGRAVTKFLMANLDDKGKPIQ